MYVLWGPLLETAHEELYPSPGNAAKGTYLGTHGTVCYTAVASGEYDKRLLLFPGFG